jgi:(heptosyl)LPS beta-1,4-glucosyltransferase
MAKKNVKLSVAIAVFNEEKNLEACLASVRQLADEIIVVDGGSHDGTVAIARKFTTHVIETDNPAMFHINKQKALDACSGDWILQLDADERVTTGLRNEILVVINSGKSDINGYFIPRRNFFWGHFMRKGGQYPDYVMRLVRRGCAHFPAKSVHEQIEIDGKSGYLTEPMDHISYRTREDYWRKADTYTALAAAEMKKNGVQKNIWTWFVYNIIKPKITFLSLFIRHKGFMDGWYGLVFAYWSALHFPIAYKKFIKL